MSEQNPNLRVEVALDRAPQTKGFPAITADFLELLQRFRWDPLGVICLEPRNPMERLPCFLTPFAASKRGKVVWWVGDSAARCTCSPTDYALLLKGRALPDGMVLAGGQKRRLDYSKGWAQLVPGDADPVETRRHLVTLSNNVVGFLAQLDEVMKQPSTVERGRAVAALCNSLDLANQTARYFGLDVKSDAKMKKMLPGGVR